MYLSIGTAKPDPGRFNKMAHHLFDFVDPSRQFNAGEFVKMADACIEEIHARKNIPLIVGGTGFYIKNFLYGLPETPPSDQKIRRKLKKEAAEKGLANLYDRLALIDPVYAEKVRKKDLLRIIRALEVYELTGKPVTSFDVPGDKRDGLNVHITGLTLERAELYKRIDDRVDAMFERGLPDEVKRLLEMGFTEDDPGMKGIGYREFFLMQQGCFTFPEIKELIKQNTRRYAKRQITYFKTLPGIRWHHPDETETMLVEIMDFLRQSYDRDLRIQEFFHPTAFSE